MSGGRLAREGALLAWFGARQRDLPWRRTRDPWSILVAELMLQQTQVARVLPRYEAFLAQWPTATACAAAPVGDIVTAWAGLGYNRRAVNLHRCARAVVADHDGALPVTLDGLLALPGIGPYTARAVLAFAHESDQVGVLDTNAARVLARWEGRSLKPKEAQAAADGAVPAGQGWAWNQAMLDLGATICRPRRPGRSGGPRCDDCPAMPWCTWAVDGRPEPDPAVGSAGVSGGQSVFEGSDRQGRGRLVDALRIAPVEPAHLAAAMGWPDDPARAERVARTLVADGLAVADADRTLRLPG
ncbi:A/G-specific adenine glycosylase [Aquihabitans sp. McL0605]|uniref:A/G-specific adenine glycosylase n=1 Tax=Aquihabitans sp. McL0605 TaxID=3415671 RepID=UPI003CEBA334